MASILRFNAPRTSAQRRWTIGVLLSRRCTKAAAALVAAAGRGLDAEFHVAGVLTETLPKDTVSLFAPLAEKDACSAEALTHARSRLAEIEASLIADLLAELGVSASRVLAVGVHDPGVWTYTRSRPTGYFGLCDAAQLAELTGLNVIDAFPARDLAQGGQGGPLEALAEWGLLRDPGRGRVLLQLGRTVKLTYLPPAVLDGAVARILSFEVGPGTSLLDALASRFTSGEHLYDPGGRLAVQGRRIDELIEYWMADPYFDRPLPRWHPRGVRPERFLADSLQMAVAKQWSVRDLLCSATHFVAETIAAALNRRLPDDAKVDEIILTGGGQQNGLLLREIGRLAEVPLVRIAELGLANKTLAPASIAVLAQLYIDQVPANPTAITGTEIPRVLGRLTPGSPQNWQRLLAVAAGSSPAVRPLRSAL